MSRLRIIFFICLFPFSLHAYTARQNISVSYFDEETVKFHIPNPPNFIKNGDNPSVEKGVMILYERKLLDLAGFVSAYVGCNLARWRMAQDQIFTTSAFLSCRLWLLHLPFAHTYAEYSVFGPTLLSKEHFHDQTFGTNFLFQSFYGAGVELGEGRGFSIDLKIVRYTKTSEPTADYSIYVPILVSMGYLF